MLATISWKEYLTFMGGLLSLYYGWWILKYAPILARGIAQKRREADGRVAALYKAKDNGIEAVGEGSKEAIGAAVSGAARGATVSAAKATVLAPAGRATVSAEKATASVAAGMEGGIKSQLLLPPPAVNLKPPFLPALAEALMNELVGLLEKVAAEGIAEVELVYALQRLLSGHPYRQLRGTVFQDKVTDRMVRVLEKQGSIRLDAKVVSALWDG